jgi:hypothetical protein
MRSWLPPRAGRFTPTSSSRRSLVPEPRNCAPSPGRMSISMRPRPSSWSGVLSALVATPRPGSHAAPLSYRNAAQMRSASTAIVRTRSACERGTGGTTTTWCSPPASAPRSGQGTSAVRSGPFLLLRASTRRTGRTRAAAQFRFADVGRGCPNREDRSPLSATPGRPQPKPSTASRSVPWSLAAQKSWTACSPGGTPMLKLSS